MGIQSTERMIQVIGELWGRLPSSFDGELGRKKKAVVIVMRLEAGGTLLNFLQSARSKGYRAVDKLRLLQQLARCFLGLAEIHEAGVVHGDIKNSNLFLSRISSSF